MTKRRLLHIIVALIIIDVGAAFWYFATRAEKEENASMAFDRANLNQAVVDADTIGDAPIPDVYSKIKQTHRYFISTKPAIDGDTATYYGCAKHTWLRLPQSINGNKNVPNLLSEIERKLWPNKYVGITTDSRPFDMAIRQFESNPEFNSPEEIAFREINYKPNVSQSFFSEQTIKVFPVFTSDIFLVMRVERVAVNSLTEHKLLAFVIYDRERQNVISWNEIIDHNKENSILKLINAKIDTLNKGDKSNYQHAFALPREIRPGRYGVMFVFQQGTIADGDLGVIEIFLPYRDVLPFLTPNFQAIVKRNNGFWEYKSL